MFGCNLFPRDAPAHPDAHTETDWRLPIGEREDSQSHQANGDKKHTKEQGTEPKENLPFVRG